MHPRAVQIAKQALLQEPSQRDGFVRGACLGDDGLASQVRELMALMDAGPRGGAPSNEAPTAMSTSGANPAGMAADGEAMGVTAASISAAGDGPGTMVGPYKILQLIGEGGFGYVYMAQQSHPVKRKVALKIVKPGMDTKQVIGRFETERQALAMMDHPNIARVYDAGATPTGRPYFVMELVRGEPITQYCDSANLTTDERLRLVIDVCNAVQHAHLKGIVHRDLKPSNVLVTLHDGTPVVKVIDFGIAKAMNEDLTDRTVFTEFRQFVGTPEYMSPEQAAMSGIDVDYRTDIYSLGVLLYELMAGVTPFDAGKLRSAGLAEIQRIIREDEPPRPSTRVSRATMGARSRGGAASAPATGDAAARPTRSTTAETVARHRRTDPRTLRKMLAGDVDWIVMKAMEKDRRRRYETAAALAEDIRRQLNHEPILARPPSAAYRFRKFARRNRVGLGAAGGAVSAMLLTLAALAYGLIEAKHQRDLTAERETETRAQMLLSTMNSVRKYTADNVRPALQAQSDDYHNHFVREMVPGFGARQVYLNFRQDPKYHDFIYKEASHNPTNRENLADEFETALVRKFAANRDLKEESGIVQRGQQRTFYLARPMVIGDAKCLDCHTTPEKAPPEQIKLYGANGWSGGYGWQMNEVIAAQMVYVPVSEAFRAESNTGIKVLGGAAAVCLVGGLLSLLLLTRRG